MLSISIKLGYYIFIWQGFSTAKRMHLAQLHISIQLIKKLILLNVINLQISYPFIRKKKSSIDLQIEIISYQNTKVV